MKASVVIVAAGEGRRLGKRKFLLELEGKPIIMWTLEPFLDLPDVGEIVLVVHHKDRLRCGELVREGSEDRVRVVTGGRERQDSVYEGLRALQGSAEVIVVHDGARPFVTTDAIHSVVGRVASTGAGVIVATPANETVKRVVNGKVVETLPRKLIWVAQTPQAFPAEMLMRAYEQAMKDGFYATDDAALCERMGYPVEVIEGDPDNVKITTPADMRRAEMIVRSRAGRP